MYYNILPELKNAIRARKERMTVPFSAMDLAVLKVLAEAGYVKSAEKETAGKKSVIVVTLSRDLTRTDVDFKFMSTPSRHQYRDYRSLQKVRQGHGAGVLSTSKGIMTVDQARKQKVGGEYLFEIW